ncbi:hypothetical protein E2C01_074293 [Portunus trituberculatus]|uniref:DUF397 domain-containing protein n=1 Tax=Portunus trituberculatus TaxID=210409 RepID=A0A5B7ICX7_PORTR|nr:hypothetical protein [Portunus trituberculatus]
MNYSAGRLRYRRAAHTDGTLSISREYQCQQRVLWSLNKRQTTLKPSHLLIFTPDSWIEFLTSTPAALRMYGVPAGGF